MYHDEYAGTDEALLDQYYGIHGRELIRGVGQTGAGHLDEDLEDSVEGRDLCRIAQIEEGQLQQVRHKAVEVPEEMSPFRIDTHEADFFALLENVIAQDIVPEGYGLLPGELDDEDVEMVEVLRFGLRGTKSIVISLTEPIWAARTKLWAQAIDLLSIFNAAGQCVAE